MLAGLEKRAEKIRPGIITTAENAMADHQHTALSDHLAEFIATMQAAGRAESHVMGTERLIQRAIDELSLRRLTDIRAEAVEHWLDQQTMAQPDKPAMGARTRNSYLIALRSFCNWCVERDRLPLNPLAKISHADEKVDQRRQRRALTEAELSKLLMVARLRPLAEFGRETIKTSNQDTTSRPGRRISYRLPWQFWWQFPLTFREIRSQRLSRWTHFRRTRTSVVMSVRKGASVRGE